MSNKCLYTYKGHTKRVTHLVKNKSKDKFLSASDDSTIRIWKMKSFSESDSGMCLIVFFADDNYLIKINCFFKVLRHVLRHLKLNKNIGKIYLTKIIMKDQQTTQIAFLF